jgi:membrane-associated PAP2 superfamily phosphatase
MSTRARAVRTELVALLVLLAAATAIFWTTRLDLAAADVFREPCCSWPVAERPFWRFLYRYGVLAGVLLAAGALVTLTLSYWYPRRLHAWRRPALFLVLVAALGPGLVVNVLFKDHYGRPRPREVIELGGPERFLPVWVKGSDPQAKSFPCGHCSMGFYLATPYLVLRRRRRWAAWGALALGTAFGGIMGVARMAAGGHFLSDVVWSAGMTWLVALAAWRVLRLDREEEPAPEAARDPRKARLAAVLGGGALAVLTAAVLLATPYVSSKTFSQSAAQVAASPAALWEVSLDEGTVAIEAGPAFEASYEVQAFGFPTSKMSFAFREEPARATLGIERLGWFTERRTTLRLRLPPGGERPFRVALGKGNVALDLRGFSPAARLDVEVEEGTVRVLGASALDGDRLRVRVARGEVVRDPPDAR